MRNFWVIVELWRYTNYGQFHLVDITLRSKVLQQNWLQIPSEINWTNQTYLEQTYKGPLFSALKKFLLAPYFHLLQK